MENAKTIETSEVYEPPEVAEVGGYADVTLGFLGSQADVVIGRYVYDR